VTEAKYLAHLNMAHCDWMYAVLDNKKETELCVFENDHFKLQKDYKFYEGDLFTLYLLAMPKALRNLRSIRDLTAEHLPFLKSVQEESFRAIEATYGVDQSKVLAYFHYLPTYWLLHVHFVHIDRMSTDARSSVPLEQVIANLEICGDYYKKVTLVYSVQEKHELCKAMIEAQVVTLPKVSEKPKVEVQIDQPEDPGEKDSEQPEEPEESKEVAAVE
jgi:m7GpppX diphosphatase